MVGTKPMLLKIIIYKNIFSNICLGTYLHKHKKRVLTIMYLQGPYYCLSQDFFLSILQCNQTSNNPQEDLTNLAVVQL